MHPSDNDPYHTPSADLNTEVASNRRMQSLPRLSAWIVFGLTIITLGLYYTYWLFTRTKIINQVHSDKISNGLVSTVLGLLLVNIIISFFSAAYPDNTDYAMLANLSSIVYSLSNLYWVFTVRNRIHQMSHANNQTGYWLGGVMTFLFQVLYMQYKINEYIDNHSSESSLAS